MLTKISQYILIASLIANCLLIYEVQTLPNQIAKTINPSGFKKDTIVKIVSDNLDSKGNFIYLKGEIIEEPRLVGDKFEWSPENPNEFYNGYFYLVESNNGGKYFIWRKTNNTNIGVSIDGWFISVNNGKWQNKKDYLDVLIPVMERTSQKSIIN